MRYEIEILVESYPGVELWLGALGIPRLAQGSLSSTAADRERPLAQPFATRVTPLGDGHRHHVVCDQLVVESARLAVGRVHEEFGLVIADCDDNPAPLVGGALLESHERIEHLEALGTLVDHISRHDQNGIASAPANGARSTRNSVDQMVLGEERDQAIMAAMHVADREDRSVGLDLDHRRVRRPITGTRSESAIVPPPNPRRLPCRGELEDAAFATTRCEPPASARPAGSRRVAARGLEA